MDELPGVIGVDDDELAALRGDFHLRRRSCSRWPTHAVVDQLLRSRLMMERRFLAGVGHLRPPHLRDQLLAGVARGGGPVYQAGLDAVLQALDTP